jgi:hypothetical protein
METYTWKRKTDDFIFSLYIDECQTRFGDEGILQSVVLDLGNFIMYDTTFGRKFAYEHFEEMTKEDMNKYIEEYDFSTSTFSYQFSNSDFDDFKCWLLTSLTPIGEQRKEKIDRIQKKIPYVTI